MIRNLKPEPPWNPIFNTGYDWRKLETALEACSDSMLEIHEDSSSIPSYPAHLTRYCKLHLYCWLSLELEFSEILYLDSPSTLARGGGGWMQLRMVFGVDGLRMET